MDKYSRVKKIGEGAFGKAILVRSKESGKQCVIKEISLGRMGPKEREDSRKEVAVLAQLNHPNIVTYLESFEERGTLYICMDYCSGGDLYSVINAQRGALIAEEQIWTYFVQICLAVKHIHDRKILHRDIKSQNIFLTGDGKIKIGDFGIAKVLNNTMELARTCIGTPYYLSPELVENKPYNNKSDVWSIGCVLYEMTTLKHAFEAGNMKNLVLKIIRGVYPPIPPKYSYDLRGIIAQLFKRSPRDRPSINALLRKNVMMQKVRNLLSDQKLNEEFSHTIMHGKKISRALPPPPRPASARPSSACSSRPGSAAKKSKPAQSTPRYNPAAVYGQPLVKKSKESRQSADGKKKNNGGGGRIIPAQPDWEKKRQELRDREKQRREEEKQKDQDLFVKQHKELVQKQKIAQINKSREEGWRNLIDPVPAANIAVVDINPPIQDRPPAVIPRKQEANKFVVGEKGNYEQYNAYLDKLQQDRINRIRDGGPVPLPRPAAIPYMQAQPEVNAVNRLGREQFQFNRGAGQADRRALAEAAERKKLAAEFLNRKQEAAQNKARGQAQLYGISRPSSAQRAVTPKLQVRPGAAVAARNKEEQDYLAQLRRIREQNMKERKMILAYRDVPSPDLGKYKPPLDEERQKKMEALKQQADDWSKRNKEEAEKAKKDLIALRKNLEEQAKSKPPSKNFPSRPSSAKKAGGNMKPAPAVPITGVLKAIGAGDDRSPTPDDKALTRQQQKENILKRLNDNPARSKWEEPGTFVPASGETQVIAEEEDQNKARSQWEDGEKVKLSDLPLEQTSSQMEATGATDQVIRSPDGKVIKESEKGGEGSRHGWGRPGSTVVHVLQGLPIIDSTMSSTVSAGSDGNKPASPLPPANIVSGIGATITINKPLIREGTITIKSAEESSNNKGELEEFPSNQNVEEINLDIVHEPITSVVDTENDTSPDKNLAIDEESKDNNVNLNSQDKNSDVPVEENKPISNGASETSQSCNTSTTVDSETIGVDKQVSRLSVAERLSNRFSKDAEKPEVPPKPKTEFKKPVLLPKPDLTAAEFAKPVIAPVVLKSDGEGSLFSKVDLDDDEDDKKSPSSAHGAVEDDKEDGDKEKDGKMVAKGLTTGNFDIGNVKMIRTCSEPDLSKLTSSEEKSPSPPLSRHLSLEHLDTLQEEEEDFESVKQSLSMLEICSPKSDSSQPKSEDGGKQETEKEKNLENVNSADSEEDDDIVSVRATMSLYLGNMNSDDEESSENKIDFKLSDTSQKKCKGSEIEDEKQTDEGEDDNDDSNTEENDDDNDDDDDEDDDDENEDDDDENEEETQNDEKDEDEDNKTTVLKHSQSDSVLSKGSSLITATIKEWFDDDSDGETTFGDEDEEEEEYDVYGRLEEARAELEEALGFDLFIKVYNAVQALQEDEDENIEEGTKIAMDLLGEENQKYYPKIFQLVMADTAFTEDNV